MSFKKAIDAGKEPRRKRGLRSSPGCSHPGSCNSCKDNRLYRTNRLLDKAKQEQKDSKFNHE